MIDLFFWTYTLLAPLQEFLMRGVLQSSVERILSGRHRTAWAVVTTAVLFGACHTTYSVPFALITVGAGLVWGWLYTRHRNLAGITLSHIIVGQAFILTGFWDRLAF